MLIENKIYFFIKIRKNVHFMIFFKRAFIYNIFLKIVSFNFLHFSMTMNRKIR